MLLTADSVADCESYGFSGGCVNLGSAEGKNVKSA